MDLRWAQRVCLCRSSEEREIEEGKVSKYDRCWISNGCFVTAQFDFNKVGPVTEYKK